MGLIYSLWEMGQSGRLDSVALSWGLMSREKFSKSGESVGGGAMEGRGTGRETVGDCGEWESGGGT